MSPFQKVRCCNCSVGLVTKKEELCLLLSGTTASLGSSRGMRGSQSNLNVNSGSTGGAVSYRTSGRLVALSLSNSHSSDFADPDPGSGAFRIRDEH